MRPDKSGILATMYPPTDEFGGRFNASIHVTDKKLAGDIRDIDSKLNSMIAMLIEEGVAEIRIVFSPLRRGDPMILFKNGQVHMGVILPPTSRDAYEELNFVSRNEPIAGYYTGLRGEDDGKAKTTKEIEALLRQRLLPGKAP